MSDFAEDTNVPTNDCISRQAAIDAVHEEFDECLVWDESGEYTADEVERILDRVPSVEKYVPGTNAGIRAAEPKEQQEIIRCRDCKHWDKTWTNDWAPDYHYCPIIDGARKCDFYCADAERRMR